MDPSELVARSAHGRWLTDEVLRGLAWRVGGWIAVVVVLVTGATMHGTVAVSLRAAALTGCVGLLCGGAIELAWHAALRLDSRWPGLLGVEGPAPPSLAATHRLYCGLVTAGVAVRHGVLWLAPGRASFVPDSLGGRGAVSLGKPTASVVQVSRLRRILQPWPRSLLCLRADATCRYFLVADVEQVAHKVKQALEG